MRRPLLWVLLLAMVLVPAVRLAGTPDSGHDLSLKHARSAPGAWRTAAAPPGTSDAVVPPTRTWWMLTTELSASPIDVSSAPFVPPRRG